MSNAESKIIKGGEFMVSDPTPGEVFIPEDFDEEQQMIGQTCDDFLETEVIPLLDRIDAQEEGLMRTLLQKTGEMGLLAISIPEEYDGFGQSFVTSMLASEKLGAGYSYAVAFSCHTGIGMLPIMYYGNEEQKKKYIPRLATGEWIGAYCLTEPGAGSDANAGTTRATLSEDGKHYILNGQKMWITNGGFADVFTVFAKVDNDRVQSAFIVEKDTGGMTFNPEEKKMGIKGSSTRQIFFNDCKVPVENMLGKQGEGFRIALNILHMGRIKLGGNVIGAAKRAIDDSIRYANERKQFNCLIVEFDAIKYKLSEQVIRTYVTESAVYRASKYIDDTITQYLEVEGREYGRGTMEAFADYAVETAAMKVFGSETLDYVVDEAVQIYGGMGFSAEMPVDRAYRDSRINRIFEGTNEINRILVVDTLMKRGQKKKIPLYEEAEKVLAELPSLKEEAPASDDYYKEKAQVIKNFKKLALVLIKMANDKFARKLVFEQQILFNISNIIMQLYGAESTMLRVQKLEQRNGAGSVKLYKDILDVFVHDSASLIRKEALDATCSFVYGEQRDQLLKAVEVFTKVTGPDIRSARRRIADKLAEENKYCF